MKRILALTAAPLLISGAVIGAAFADNNESGVSIGADAEVNGSAEAGTAGSEGNIGAESDASAGAGSSDTSDQGSGVGVDAQTTESTGTGANFGSVISAIQASGSAATDVEAVSDASQVEIVRVSELAEGESMNALDEALANNQTAVDELRTAVEANTAISQHLEQEQIQTENVVAAETSADGSVTLYVR